MALMKLVVLAVIVAAAFAHGHGGGRGGIGGKWNWHGVPKCEAPSADKTADLDQASQQQIAAIWATYNKDVDANCTQQLKDTGAVFKAHFEAQIQAKAAALTGTAKDVYAQIQAIKTNTPDMKEQWKQIMDLVKQQDEDTKKQLSELLPFGHKGGMGGKWGGKGHGEHGGKGDWNHAPKCEAPSADKTAELDQASQQQIAAIWATYNKDVNANCSQQLKDTWAVFKAHFEAQIQAKAAALTGTAKDVYDQIQAIRTNTPDMKEQWKQIMDLVKKQDPTVQAQLFELLPRGHKGGMGGKWGGKGHGSSEEEEAN